MAQQLLVGCLPSNFISCIFVYTPHANFGELLRNNAIIWVLAMLDPASLVCMLQLNKECNQAFLGNGDGKEHILAMRYVASRPQDALIIALIKGVNAGCFSTMEFMLKNHSVFVGNLLTQTQYAVFRASGEELDTKLNFLHVCAVENVTNTNFLQLYLEHLHKSSSKVWQM